MAMVGRNSLQTTSSRRQTRFLIMFVLLHATSTTTTTTTTAAATAAAASAAAGSGSSPTSYPKMATFQSSRTDNVLFTQNVLSEVAAVSKIDCGRQCVDTAGCVMFTFQDSRVEPSRRCRVYGQVHSLSDHLQISHGARSYALDSTALEPCPSGYSQSCGRCLTVGKGLANYTDAIVRCGELDQGQLVLTKTAEDLHCVANFGAEKGVSETWVGADDLAVEGVYKWGGWNPSSSQQLYVASPWTFCRLSGRRLRACGFVK